MTDFDEASMIEGRGLSKTYARAKRPALSEVSLRVQAGEILGVIGPNGSGKTTLMGCMLGLLKADQGASFLGGQPVAGIPARRLVGYLPERLGFDPWMKGADFLSYHHALAALPASDRAKDVEAMLLDMGLDRAAWSRPIRGYSRGMLQRLGLAQALIGKPRCLFLDEPTSGMDPDGVLKTRSRIQAFAASGGAVVVNSHQLDQLGKLCHQVLFLKEGRIEATERLQGAAGLTWFVEWLPREGGQAKAKAALEKLDLKARTLKASSAQVDLPDEEAAAALVAALVKAGVPVLSAGPLKGDLERFFTGAAHASE
ncbi:MAG TPA: ABC transporter ATP-binding protein [bacterium]|jgi:ABC-2 type transport system ATP-binding protein|nr:ABC transporter ATP-binding protein [bacterium]